MCVVLCVCTVEKVRGGSVVSVCCAVCVYSGEGEGWECGECVLCCVCVQWRR